MARGRCTFRQSDLVRALKATRAAGMGDARVEVRSDGTIIVVPGGGGAASPANENPWDEVLHGQKT